MQFSCTSSRCVVTTVGLVLFAGTAVAQWSYSIERIEPRGSAHVSALGAVSSSVTAYGKLGAYGTSNRLGAGISSGNDVWFWNGTTTTIVGVPDAENTRASNGRRNSFIGPVDPATGWVVGRSQRYIGTQALGFSSWMFDGVATRRLGLTGPAYEGPAGLQNHEAFVDIVRRPAGAFWVLGFSDRYDAPSVGRDGWVFDGIRTRVLGPDGPEFVDGNNYRMVTSMMVDGEQQMVVGTSVRAAGGTATWLWRDEAYTLIAPTQGDFTNPAGIRSSAALFPILPNGQVLGWATRYNPGTTAPVRTGDAIWLYDGVTTQVLDLPTGYISVTTRVIKPGITLVAGTATQLPASGTSYLLPTSASQAWVVKNGAAFTLGLTGAGYQGSAGFEVHSVTSASDAGVVAGFSERIAGVDQRVGRDAWVWDGVTYQQLGLTGPEYINNTYGTSSSLAFISPGGIITGSSYRYDFASRPRGSTVWIFSGGTYQTPGLNDATHTSPNGTRESGIGRVWDDGSAFGEQTTYSSATSDTGKDIWQFAGGSTVLVGLVGPEYISAAGLRYTGASYSNEAGVIIGKQTRSPASPAFNDQLWYFDPTTRITHHMKPASEAYMAGSLTRLDEDGFAYGSSSTTGGAFVFRPDIGFVWIKDLVAGGLGSGWRVLGTASFDNQRQQFVGDGVIDEPNGSVSFASFAVSLDAGCAVGTLCCDSIDFNNNAVFPEDQDVIDFLAVLSGAECGACNDIDFNNNGVFPEDQDVIDFFNVLAGGNCS